MRDRRSDPLSKRTPRVSERDGEATALVPRDLVETPPMVNVALMNSRLVVLIGLVVAVGLAVAALYHFTQPLAGVQGVNQGGASVRTFAPPRTEVDASDAGSLAVESLERGASRDRYNHLLEAIRTAARDRQIADPAPAPAAPSGDEVDQRAATAYSPDEMPVPGTRTSDAPIPSPEEQHRFFAALTERADPLVDDCYRALPEPRPAGELKLVWTTVYDHDVGTVVERIELDQTSEITDARVLECARESIFSVQLPDLAGYGRLQVTSNQDFEGQHLVDEPAEPSAE